VVPLFFYGTIMPCEMLKKEVKAQFYGERVSLGSSSRWEPFSPMVSMSLGGKMIDEVVGTLSPPECYAKLVEVRFKGVQVFSSFRSSSRP
jgi:hypothetical protein